MNATGDRARSSVSQVKAEVAAAQERLVLAIRAHADAVANADEAGARTARAAITSAMRDYSWAIDDAWQQVPPFPLPRTLREREGPAPRQISLRVTYHLQVLDKDRLMDYAEDPSCEPVSDVAEAAAALYGARVWWPIEDTGLVSLIGSHSGGFEQT